MSIRTTVSTLVLAGKPAVVVDVASEDDVSPLSAEADPLPWSFMAHGLRLLPGFLGVAVPDDTGLRLGLQGGHAVWLTEAGGAALAVPVDDLPDGWVDAAQEHGGVLVFVGRGIDVATAQDGTAAGAALHAAAVAGRVVGGIAELDLLAGGV